MTNPEAVLAALSEVRDPELHRDIVSLNMVRDLAVEGATASFRLVLTTPACPLREQIDVDVRAALDAVPGIDEVKIEWDAEVRGQASREGGPEPVTGVKNLIAVASNKGGVGKSTVATNLAVALAQLGAAVGIVDADITGPNIPTMLGIEQGSMAEGQQGMHTIEAHGVRAVSIGFVLPKGTPVVWRGPMIGSGVRQLIHDIDWGELDYLIVDLPAGHLGTPRCPLAQQAPVAGVVIVSTPQRVAIEDATKAIGMFDRLGRPDLRNRGEHDVGHLRPRWRARRGGRTGRRVPRRAAARGVGARGGRQRCAAGRRRSAVRGGEGLRRTRGTGCGPLLGAAVRR